MSRRIFATPEAVELAFYRALAEADFSTMRSVWSESDDLICVHPLGARLVGQAAVMHSWREMFAQGQGVTIERRAIQRIQTQTLAVHSLFEIITADSTHRRYPPMIATNTYLLTDMGWRMLLHQAGPGPELGDKSGADSDGTERTQFH